ncbi:MAG: 50S ribosomal protein L22 [Candidatus Levybacteria bacterium]|nr:50S ribosomal protein L22 [Candidatus Levybacteria bacterium]
MEVTAYTKSVRISPRKVRLIADVIREKTADDALRLLAAVQKRAANPLEKTIKSAIANAVHNKKIAKENLVIKRLEVTEGTALKRYHPSTRGRIHPYKKRSSHIKIVLTDNKNQKSKISPRGKAGKLQI